MREIWKPVIGYENIYEVSNLGRVKSLSREILAKRNGKSHTRNIKGRIMSQILITVYRNKKYYVTRLSDTGNPSTGMYIHRLMAKAFLPVPDKYLELDSFDLCVDHIDNNSKNNTLDNIQWISRCENSKKNPFNPSVKIRIIETGEEFDSQTDLVRHLWKINKTKNKDIGGVVSNIRKSINSDINSAYGYTYEYVDKDVL